MNTNIYSHLTAKERDSLSFPARYLFKHNLLKGKILDFGCGFGSDVRFLQQKGFNIEGYDKYYFDEYPQEQFDTILCFYVLNVLMPREQTEVLMQVSELLKPGGKAYFVVRRDIVYEGFRIHKIHQKSTYQCMVKLHYPSIHKNDNCEIYEYIHINQITTLKDSFAPTCPFCVPSSECKLISESATSYAILDKYPVNEGHALIIPKRHTASYFDLTIHEQTALWLMVNHVQKLITFRYHPDGYNIGINIGHTAGQTIDHIHIHLIPRYQYDVPDPEGGIRGVIPEKRKY